MPDSISLSAHILKPYSSSICYGNSFTFLLSGSGSPYWFTVLIATCLTTPIKSTKIIAGVYFIDIFIWASMQL